jgi:hypothetical protein
VLHGQQAVDAVASAYRSGIEGEVALAFDGKSRRDPRDKAANHIRGVREAKVV